MRPAHLASFLVLTALAGGAGCGREAAPPPSTGVAERAARTFGTFAGTADASGPGERRAAESIRRMVHADPLTTRRVATRNDVDVYAIADDANVCLYLEEVDASGTRVWDSSSCAHLDDPGLASKPMLLTARVTGGFVTVVLAADALHGVDVVAGDERVPVPLTRNVGTAFVTETPTAVSWIAGSSPRQSMELIC